MKLKSDRAFFDFLSGSGSAVRIGLVLILGLALILIGGLGGKANEKSPDTNIEERTAEMCSLMEGVGECRVMITYSDAEKGEVYAVLILCEGADLPSVRERITSACTSLYGIGSHRVEIQKLNK